jgi:hypothetical protein
MIKFEDIEFLIPIELFKIEKNRNTISKDHMNKILKFAYNTIIEKMNINGKISL